jgi:DNA-binding LytR/AlgR family response regulator
MINCLIVDDAPIAREILIEYCKHLPTLRVVGTCSDTFQAREKLQQLQVDLLFIDINMPILTGVDLVKTLKYPPQIIFTTAYKEYASEAFDLAACDYLVKPFSLERFIVAIDKAVENMNRQKTTSSIKLSADQYEYLFVRTEGMIHRINFDRILFLEASRNNTKVVTMEDILLSTMPLSTVEKQLAATLFSRIHRSFIVNTSKITRLQGNRVFIGKTEIPLGGNYKNDFLKILGL